MKLKNGYHENRYLQRSYNKYGLSKFIKYMLEECQENELNEKEKYWIEKLNSFENGYNLTIGGSGINGWKGSVEFKIHMREITLGKRNPNYGKRWSDELKERVSQKRKGKARLRPARGFS